MSGSFHTPYPDYDVLEKWDSPSYNDPTRAVLAHRLDHVPARRFFDAIEWAALVALCERVIPQPERSRAERVPIAPWIDAALHERRGNGTRYASMPTDRAAWKQGLAAIDAEARERYGANFAALSGDEQDAVLAAVNDGGVRVGEAWSGLPPQRFFRHLVLKEIVKIYYVHPAAMSEIGFGGPASPRGYVRLGTDAVDPWEAPPGRWSEEGGR
jgi:hypothetical protein